MLSLFALLMLTIVYYIDYNQKLQVKQSKKYDYLFTKRCKDVSLRLNKRK